MYIIKESDFLVKGNLFGKKKMPYLLQYIPFVRSLLIHFYINLPIVSSSKICITGLTDVKSDTN